MTALAYLASGLALGFLGSTHCAAMCGGLIAALTLALPPRQSSALNLLLVHACAGGGRIASYVIAGGLSASLGAWIVHSGNPVGSLVLRCLSGALLILLGLYLAGWSTALARLEQLGGKLWRRIHARVGQWRPEQPWPAAIVFGMVWGWLPCGLVYTALALAGTTGDITGGALLMLGFGVGTLPMVLTTGLLTGHVPRLLRRPVSRRLAGALVAGLGIWTIAAATAHPPVASAPCALHDKADKR